MKEVYRVLQMLFNAKRLVSGIAILTLILSLSMLNFNILEISAQEEQCYLFIHTYHPHCGDTNPEYGTHWYPKGTIVELTAYPDTSEGYVFGYWNYNVTPDYSNPTYITLNSNFTVIVIWGFEYTLQAYCCNTGEEINVNITVDGQPSEYTTPNTFTLLYEMGEDHIFEVQDVDPHGHPLKVLSNGFDFTYPCEPATDTAWYQVQNMPWDMTGDDYCGIDDIVHVAWYFSTEPPSYPCSPYPYVRDPVWDPYCDVTEDLYIGIDDIVAVAQHFGQTFP